MMNFDVKDLLVSIQAGVTAADQKKITKTVLHGNSLLSLPNNRRLEQSVKCIQPSKATRFAVNVTKEGPTKRKLQGSAVDPCPCPSKSPEEVGVAGWKTAIQSHNSNRDAHYTQTLAELKDMLTAMQTAAPVR